MRLTPDHTQAETMSGAMDITEAELDQLTDLMEELGVSSREQRRLTRFRNNDFGADNVQALRDAVAIFDNSDVSTKMDAHLANKPLQKRVIPELLSRHVTALREKLQQLGG